MAASRYGAAEIRPVAPMPAPEPAFTIEGSQKTNPYTPRLHSRYCTDSRTTARERKAAQ